jgi:hypothetical protein
MTRARDLANIISGGFTADDIPNLDAAKITSGTFADARIAASNVSQHATSFDDNKIVNDISTLGLRVHTQENLNASNTNSASFDVFQILQELQMNMLHQFIQQQASFQMIVIQFYYNILMAIILIAHQTIWVDNSQATIWIQIIL